MNHNQVTSSGSTGVYFCDTVKQKNNIINCFINDLKNKLK